ncbi:MAG: hypothetical protein KIT62_09220 [Cyclobacteriaceae bacterium]|nr:hypothetical protein [Cyclobacteriaceae bacterium]
MNITFISEWLQDKVYLDDEDNPSYSVTSRTTLFRGDYATVYALTAKKKKPALRIRQSRYAPFQPARWRYVIKFLQDDLVAEVKPRSYKDGLWTATLNQRTYEVKLHDGSRGAISIYRNNEQVARCGIKRDASYIIANNDEDPLFLIALFTVFNLDTSWQIRKIPKASSGTWYPVR